MNSNHELAVEVIRFGRQWAAEGRDLPGLIVATEMRWPLAFDARLVNLAIGGFTGRYV